MTLEVVHVGVELVGVNDQVAYHEQRGGGKHYPTCDFFRHKFLKVSALLYLLCKLTIV